MTALTPIQQHFLHSTRNIIRPSAVNQTWAMRHLTRNCRHGAVVTATYRIAAK